MFVFLIVLILLLAALGVLGLALKVALAAFVGITIAVVAFALVGYYMVRHQIRRAQRSFNAAVSQQRPSAMGGTSVEVGRPTRDDPPIDDRY
jgi:membrane protein implicated in regulation of membrane protease activity